MRCTILILNPTNLDEVCVQGSRVKYVNDGFSLEPIQPKEGNNKAKEKLKMKNIVKMENAKHTCSHCKREGHDEDYF